MIETFPIELREAWLSLRQSDITASIAGALLGCHEYVTAYGVWMDKTGRLPRDEEMTEAQERGTELEPIALKRLKSGQYIYYKDAEDGTQIKIDYTLRGEDGKKLHHPPKWNIWNPQVYLRDTEARVGATPDAFVDDPECGRGVIQFKSVHPSPFHHRWRNEAGIIQPPLWIVVQAIIEAHLAKAQWAAVGALVISYGIELHIVDVPIHAGVIERVYEETRKFWRLVESNATPPPDFLRDAALIAQLFAKDDGTEVDLTSDNELPAVFDSLLEARAAKQHAEVDEKKAKAAILDKLGTASFARLADGRRISAKMQHRQGYLVKPTDFRTIRLATERT